MCTQCTRCTSTCGAASHHVGKASHLTGLPTHDNSLHLTVIPVQLMLRSDIDRNMSCTVVDYLYNYIPLSCVNSLKNIFGDRVIGVSVGA